MPKFPSCWLCVLVLVVWASSLSAAPTFAGLRSAEPAPGGAVLRWGRAPGKEIRYVVYQRPAGTNGRGTVVGELRGDEWAVPGLAPGRAVEFLVRAKDATGEDANSKWLRVVPTPLPTGPEWRAAWVSRFDWTGGELPEVQQKLTDLFALLSAGNLNAVLFQVRGQGDTLYPSAEEPWSPLVRGGVRNSDPVAFAMDLAKRNNIEFHAWINLSVIWQSGSKAPPSDRAHPFYRFADVSTPGKGLGVTYDAAGKPAVWGADGYVWLTHGNPEVNAYLRRQVSAFLAKYPVAGLHWDDRTGAPNGVSRDPVSLRRFAGAGNPGGIKDLRDWQLDQLSRLLADIYVEAHAINPNILVTAGPFGIADKNRVPGYDRFSDARKFGVQPERWLSEGSIDALMPQVYWDLPDPEPNYGRVVRDWLAHNKTGRPIWPGSALGKFGDVQPLVPMQARYVTLQRALGAGGNTYFDVRKGTLQQWREFAALVYPTKVPVPRPPHTLAKLGHIMGTLRDAQGRPVVDAHVRLAGRNYTYLTSADGFFGVPNVTTGPVQLTVRLPETGATLNTTTNVVQGRVAKLELVAR